MLPANRHLLPIIGIDIHMVLILGAPVPIPHPFIGLVFDPMDWIPKIGASVRVNGMPRGNAGTDGMLGCKVHIPMGGPFAMAPMIGHDSKNFFGSPKVTAEGSYFSGAGFLLMSCNDVGIPLSITPGKKFKPIPSLYLPTSAAIPIPAGKPVVVGGPYVPDLMSMLMGLAMSFGFGALMKAGGKAMKKALTAFNKKVLKKFKCTQSLSKKFCKHGFEPVNLINGSVLYEGVDVELPGPIPFKWERTWYSDSGYEGLMGHGTHCSYDLTLLVMEQDNGIGVTLPDGRATGFPLLVAEGEQFYNRAEKLTLTCKDHHHYELFDHESRLTWQFVKRHDNVFKPVALGNKAGVAIRFFYNRKHILEKIIDTAGREILLTLDGFDRVVQIAGVHQGSKRVFVEYGYNEAGDLAAITDANGKTTGIRYANHLMVEKTDRNGQTFYWEYDGVATGARCVHTWGDGGLLEGTIDYHGGYNAVTNSLGEKKLYYYDENDLCIQETDALGNSIFYEYTDAPELYREVDQEGNITGYVYDARGNRLSVQTADGAVTAYMYDEKDQVQMITDAGGNATVYVYKNEQLESVVAVDRAVTSYEYNEQGLVTAIQNEKGQRTLLQYDADHNLVRMALPGGAVSNWEYDAWGNCIAVINPEGQSKSFGYDSLDRVVQIRGYDGNRIKFRYDAYDEVVYAEDVHHKVHFEYTPLGNLSAREENGVRIHYQYDTEQRLSSLVNERHEVYRIKRDARGKVIRETGFDGLTTEYTRDAVGKVIRVERPGKRFTLLEHDLAGRITRVEHSDGSWQLFSYDANGRMVEATNEHSTLLIQRDAKGRVTSENQDGYLVQSKYDKLGRRIEIVSNLGAAVKAGYNEGGYVGQLQAVNQEGAAWEAKYGYNILGLETERLLPGSIIATFQYDRAGRPVEQAVNNSSRSLRHRIYAWNVNDRLQSMMNGLTRGLVQYSYDEFANLAWAKYEDNTFDYRQADKTRNFYRTKEQSDRKYGPGGRLLSANGVQYDYDEAGNLVLKTTASGAKWCYEWQGHGMLKKVIRPDGKEVSFEYDALGRRTAKRFDGNVTRWVWDGNIPLHEWKYPLNESPVTVIDEWGEVHKDKDEPVANLVTWIFDEGTFRPAAKLQGNKQYSILTDYLGTPVEMYDGDGNATWSVEYDIYGKIRKQSAGNAVDCPFRLQGQYEDVETGLYYNRYRYYAPEEGIYISKDPIGLEGGLALYAFVDDPNSQTDIFGLYIYYQLKDKYGTVVYHGITERDLEDRTKEHARDGKTFTQVTYVDDLDDRVAARDLEGSALYHDRDKVLQNAERPVTPGYYHSYDPDNLKAGRTMKTAKQISLKMKTGKTVKVDDAGKIKCK
jgi:RHS repeat-associated protein